MPWIFEIDYFVIYVWCIYLIITVEFILLGTGIAKKVVYVDSLEN